MNSQNLLDLYVISCHLDKPLDANFTLSKYAKQIQAGAANTTLRTQELNDYDNFPESISSRNERYSEVTAMYWIYKNMTSPYIGISHYRRHFDLDDDQLTKHLENNVDIITLASENIGQSIAEDYCSVLFQSDWNLFLNIIQKKSPSIWEFANEYFSQNFIHACNMNIFKKKYYKEFGDWAFPILDEFYQLSPRKTDRYQRRDVGFIAERLSSLFIEYKKAQGLSIIEVPLLEVASQNWDVKKACNMDNPNDVYNTCCHMYSMDKISEAKNIIGEALRHNSSAAPKILQLKDLFLTAEYERLNLPLTMYEYLPLPLRSDLPTLLNTYNNLGAVLSTLYNNPSKDCYNLFKDFLKLTNFSSIAIMTQCKNHNIDYATLKNKL